MFKSLEKKIIQASERQGPVPLMSFEVLLKVVSFAYGSGAAFRNKWYESGRLHRKTLPCPVISIGNITAGGTGKTPMAVYLADLLIQMGKHPVVISRGYRGTFKKKAAIVGDGVRVFLTARQAGDEPYMMAALKRFPVVVGKDRYQAGCLALDRLPVDVVLLDDGFQHVRLKRDLDLVLMDYASPLGNGRFLPAGRLREPAIPALARAGAVILTRCPETAVKTVHWVSIAAPDLPVFYTRHQPFLAGIDPAGSRKKIQHEPIEENSKKMTALDRFQGVSVVLFSGIANNRAFYRTIRHLGANIVDHLEFTDHYQYQRADILHIQQRAIALNADMLVTTEKDRVRLEKTIDWPMDLAVVGIRLSLDSDSGFRRLVETVIQI
ncbi:MAG: tetraacyldisaccharide 4'-kinase [Thermodesulfobacteriota bacterium]